MSIKIRRMEMPPKGFDGKCSNKWAREGVAITALPTRKQTKNKDRREEGMEI